MVSIKFRHTLILKAVTGQRDSAVKAVLVDEEPFKVQVFLTESYLKVMMNCLLVQCLQISAYCNMNGAFCCTVHPYYLSTTQRMVTKAISGVNA